METDMDVIEVRTESVLVTTTDGGWTAVAKHSDEKGEYFLNEKLNKQYIEDSEKVEHPLVVNYRKRKRKEELRKELEAYENRKPEKLTYTFEVVTANKHGEPSRHYTKTIKAVNIEEADRKLEKNYKRIFDVELSKIDGDDVTRDTNVN